MIPATTNRTNMISRLMVMNPITRIHLGFTGSLILLLMAVLRIDDFDLAITVFS